MPEHRKWAELEEAHGAAVWSHAMALWVCVLCHGNRNETDGDIPRVTLSRLTPLSAKDAIRAADAMVSVGIMEKIDGGYRLHDFLVYNPSKADKDQARAKEAERGRQRRLGGRVVGRQVDGQAESAPRPGWTPDGQTAESTLSRPDPVPIPEEAEPPPPIVEVETEYGQRLSSVRKSWARSFEAHRGVLATNLDQQTIKTIAEAVAVAGGDFDARLAEALAAYWSDPWTREKSNRPSLRNFCASLERILAAPPAPKPAEQIDPEEAKRLRIQRIAENNRNVGVAR